LKYNGADLQPLLLGGEVRDRTRPVVDGKVECKRCGEWKFLVDYPKDKNSFLGIYSYCRECANSRAKENHRKARAKGASEWNKHRRSYRNHYYRSTYGITADDFDLMLAEQGGCCEICKVPLDINSNPSKAHLDHNHTTGDIRGILCVRCNKGIGFFLENEIFLASAIDYLRKYNGGTT